MEGGDNDESGSDFINHRLSISHHVPGSKINAATFSYKSNYISRSLIVTDLLIASGGEDGQIILQTSSAGDQICNFNAYSNKVYLTTQLHLFRPYL